MQLGPLDIRVTITESISFGFASAWQRWHSRASSLWTAGQVKEWTLAEIRISRDVIEQVLCSKGLASSALRLIVTQSTLDNLFCESITVCQPAVRRRYDVIHDMRRRLNNGPLPLNAADSKRSILKQWWRAHASILDLIRPGPEQRAMNAIRLATMEKAEMDALRVHESELERLQQVGTPLSSPHASRTNLALCGGSRSSSVEDMSSGASSPALGASADPSVTNLATLGEEPEYTRGVSEGSFDPTSIVFNQESFGPTWQQS
ncbi:unnamed protein product [Prorocentrum cordatum]|uniref:Uncharacterized protein n=1 Tax=Prorocentrum cordatum TaxID=2364126 RepID=A0ABN9X6M6_9DINO|nr:unnamed protein product [Polarella glacialis]